MDRVRGGSRPHSSSCFAVGSRRTASSGHAALRIVRTLVVGWISSTAVLPLAHATTVTVGSLPSLLAAVANSSVSVIALSQHLSLGGTELVLSRPLTLQGGSCASLPAAPGSPVPGACRLDAGGTARAVRVVGAAVQLNSLLVVNGSARADTNGAARGGGVACWTGCTLTLIDCSIVNNSAALGGGLHVDDTSSASVVRGSFTNNAATSGGGGVALDGGAGGGAGPQLQLSGTAFTANIVVTVVSGKQTSAGAGGGVACVAACRVQGDGVTAAACSAARGGFLDAAPGSTVSFANSAFVGNTALTGTGGAFNFGKQPALPASEPPFAVLVRAQSCLPPAIYDALTSTTCHSTNAASS